MPKKVADVTGQTWKNPARHRRRTGPASAPLGEASSWMTEPHREAWEGFKSELPWLEEADRTLVEIASVLRARLQTGEQVGVQALTALRQCLSALGATPADRAKIAAGDDDGDDPAAEYLQ
ncbi:MAG: hypothetical protein ACFCUT_02410 [Kiloniellaceae bacterium]